MKYRRDIDGLRSIAVLSVIAFHYFPPVLRGGFIGVDIFFVISGYLISTIIFSEIGKNHFSILKFYRRRINRIFPALSAVLLASLAFGWIALFPDEYAALGRNTLASTVFFENIYLWMQSGYFDSDSIKKPLLHVWSLGVEEQFYIIYPPMLVLANRLRVLNLKFLIICCLLSFVGSMIVVQYSQSLDFYFPLTRYWELSIGGILAWRERDMATGRAPFAISRILTPSILSAIGILSIIAGFFLIDSRTPFPGAAALLPVLGAALIIGAGPLARPSRLLLSNPVSVFVGKISYPLYLWHWPLLAFLYIVNIEKPEPPVRVVMILLTFVLATATWLLIETPIRKRHNNIRTAMVLLVMMTVIGAFGWAISLGGGFAGRAVNRINGGAVVRASGIDNPPLPVRDCTVPDAVARQFRNCIENHGEPAQFIMLGDSKADALYHGLLASSNPGGRWLYLGGADATTFGAPEPLVTDHPAWSRLQPQSRAAIDYIASDKNIRVVLYVAALRNVYQLDDANGAARVFNAYDSRYLTKLRGNILAAPAQAAVIEAVGRLVAAGKIVALLVDNPPLPPLRTCNGRVTSSDTVNMMLNLRQGASDPYCHYAISKYRADAKVYLDMLAAVKARFKDKVILLDFTNTYCQEQNGYCGTSMRGNALYGYTDHISSYTAGIIGRLINRRLEPFGNARVEKAP